MKEKTKEQIEWRYIQDLIEKKNIEVVATMKKIKHGLFSWKFEVEKC